MNTTAPDFVIVANAWGAGIANPTSKHRIAAELARRGHRVLWVEGAGMRRPRLGSGSDRSRIRQKLRAAFSGARPAVLPAGETGGAGIWVLTPLLIPAPGKAWVRALNGWLVRAAVRHWARRLGFGPSVLINYVPVLAECMRGWRPRAAWPAGKPPRGGGRFAIGRVVYHCVDRWDAFQMYDTGLMARVDARCSRCADVVIASAHELYERCQRQNPRTVLVMHGVDHEHFAAALAGPARPADLPAGPVVGFFGLLSEWVDQELLVRLAQDLPAAQIVLLGAADVPIDRLRGIANLHVLGPRPFRELPRYVAYFDVGIIPFLVNDLTRSVNPIKLREMLSAGCPVVSTDLPEVRACAAAMPEPQAVALVADGDGFVRAVTARIEQPLDLDARRRLSGAMAGETWEVKVDTILKAIADSPGDRAGSGAPDRGLTPEVAADRLGREGHRQT